MSGNRPVVVGAIAAMVFLVGYGIALHDFAHQVWELKGYHNLVEGGYIGFAMMAPVVLGVLIVFLRNSLTLARSAVTRRDAVDKDDNK